MALPDEATECDFGELGKKNLESQKQFSSLLDRVCHIHQGFSPSDSHVKEEYSLILIVLS